MTYVWILLKILILLVPILIAVAFLTLVERKVIASMQRRKGPNVVGFLGLLQPFADALKLLVKELILPSYANKMLFLAAPLITFVLSLVAWAVIPFGAGAVLADLNVGLMFLSAISGLAVYGIILSGWASNSNYAFLGALRSAAQMVSYEVSLGLIIMNVLLITGSLNLSTIVACQEKQWFFLPLFPLFILYFISILAETNRHPFDLPEAEGELVAGYNVEYSAMSFALFFIGEYGNMILMSSLTAILFLGGWLSPLPYLPSFAAFVLKILFLLFLFIWFRAGLPRYRYDQLMRLGWKVFLPLSIGLLTLTSCILYSFQYLP